MFLGPILSIPIGFTIFSVIWVVLNMIASEISWKVIDHYPEDEVDWSDGNDFVIDED